MGCVFYVSVTVDYLRVFVIWSHRMAHKDPCSQSELVRDWGLAVVVIVTN